MKPVERFHNLVHGGSEPYQPLVIPMIAADHAAYIASIPFKTVMTDHEAVIDAYGRIMEVYSPEGLILFYDVSLEAEAAGATLYYPEDSAPYPIDHIPGDCIPEVDPNRDGRLPSLLKALRALVKQWGDLVPVFCSLKDPFSLAAQTIGATELFEATILDPAEVDRVMTRTLANQRRFMAEILDAGAVPFIGAPMATGSLISQSTFDRFVTPSVADLAQLSHEAGSSCTLHICGNVNPLLASLAKIPVDLLSIESIDPDLIGKHRLNAALMGLARTDVILLGSPDDCRKEAVRSRMTLPDRSVLSTGCDVPQSAPVENVMAFIDEAKEASGLTRDQLSLQSDTGSAPLIPT